MSNDLVKKNRNVLKQMFETDKIKDRIVAMLGKNADSFITSVINVYAGSDYLAECEPITVVKSAMVAASMNLPIDPNLGFSAIVPYKDRNKGMQAQFQIMYKGFVQLAIRSGMYETINVTEVYADEFKGYNPFTGKFEFTDPEEWKMRYEDNREVVGYFAYFELLAGFKKQLYATKAEVEKHANTYSQSYKSDKRNNKNTSRWSQDFDSMGKKTVLKQLLSKYGVLSVDMQKAQTFDQSVADGNIDGLEPKYIDNPNNVDVVDPFAETLEEVKVDENN